MEDLFANDTSSDEGQQPFTDGVSCNSLIPELKLEPAAITGDADVFDDDGIDLCSPWAFLDMAESNPSVLLPTVLPGPVESSSSEPHPIEFFNTPGTHFMHVQMPNAMPHLDKERTLRSGSHRMKSPDVNRHPGCLSHQAKTDVTDEPLIYQTSKVSCLPSGRLGHIRIHKSGKIKLHVSGHVFNFAPGNKVSCKQQVGCFLEENNEFLFLGNYRKKFVVSPDYSALLGDK